ncbi:MAG: SdpI family protein [Candidatus Omnitrophota bacterium]
MTTIQASSFFINLIMGLLFIALGIPLAKRKIPMNCWYGFRIPKAFKSPELWYEINAYGGRQMVLWSIPILMTAIACFFVPLREDSHPITVVLLGGGALTIFVSLAIARTLMFSSKIAKF